MEQITSFRLEKSDLDFLNDFSRERNESKGKALRELIENGRILIAVKMYKDEKISIGKAAEIAGVCLSDMIDLLSEFGIKSNLTLEDFKESLKNTKKLRAVK
ncbi:UPF0175 family protein [Candidatus Woesearchaeota archaeon]|nr:UPF0175 family protein [Candidatus Woesearchaeota archaeon]